MIFNRTFLFAPKLILTSLLICVSISYSFAQLQADLVNNEGWIKGNFVEIGINDFGVYGASNITKPPNFHDNRESDGNNIFGFIANPQKDDWIDYDGDFFTPGSPEEGFSIEIDGLNYSNNNSSFFNQIDGGVASASIFSSDCFEDYAQIVWTGEIDGLSIRRFFSITEDGLFIQMITNITNISSATKKNVFFLHNVDPDNNQSLSGNYSTINNLISQASSPTDNICLVKASQDAAGTPQDMDGSHVSFYAKDERARVSYGGFTNRNASGIWNGISVTNTEGSINTDDIAISIAFNIGNIAPAESVNFTYYYILEEVDENFEPLIVNIVPINPSICESEDGKFIISGLTPGETYEISYEENGIPIPLQSYIANPEGTIEITDLSQGVFSQFSISYTGCTTSIDSEFELTDPPVYFNIDKTDPTSCLTDNGILILTDLSPSTTYHITYDKNGFTIPETPYISDADGEIQILNLSPAIYDNITVRYTSCQTTSDEVLTISHAGSPIYNLLKSNPIDCSGNNGSINITGLISNTEYLISYTDDGVPINLTINSDSNGIILIENLDNGVYTDFIVELLGCITDSDQVLELNGPENPILSSILDQYYCDEDHDYIINNIDLSIYDSDALNGLSSALFSVSYHSSEENAMNNIAVSKDNYSTIGLDNYTIYARVTNNSTNCYNYIPIIINVNIPADFEIIGGIICLNDDDTPNEEEFGLPIIDTFLSEIDYSFQWFLSEELIVGETQPVITIHQPGIYDVLVTDKLTDCTITKSAEIIPSGRPKEYEITVTSNPFSTNHTVEITASGHGVYEYSIDDEVQSSPVFENILLGFHDFCIIDTQGCGDICEEIMIIDYMKFFTPNNDSSNDGWRIIGAEFLNGAKIFIYDRSGKLITELNPNGETWDGLYNGKKLPSSDYWFTVEFNDNNNLRRTFKAHFTLKR